MYIYINFYMCVCVSHMYEYYYKHKYTHTSVYVKMSNGHHRSEHNAHSLFSFKKTLMSKVI